jgi:predicted HicB family RNase H-like nuclease
MDQRQMTRQLRLLLRPSQHARLRLMAKEAGISMNEVIRRAVFESKKEAPGFKGASQG